MGFCFRRKFIKFDKLRTRKTSVVSNKKNTDWNRIRYYSWIYITSVTCIMLKRGIVYVNKRFLGFKIVNKIRVTKRTNVRWMRRSKSLRKSRTQGHSKSTEKNECRWFCVCGPTFGAWPFDWRLFAIVQNAWFQMQITKIIFVAASMATDDAIWPYRWPMAILIA